MIYLVPPRGIRNRTDSPQRPYQTIFRCRWFKKVPQGYHRAGAISGEKIRGVYRYSPPQSFPPVGVLFLESNHEPLYGALLKRKPRRGFSSRGAMDFRGESNAIRLYDRMGAYKVQSTHLHCVRIGPTLTRRQTASYFLSS